MLFAYLLLNNGKFMNKRIDLHTKNSIVFKLNPDLKVLGDELVQRAQDSEKEFMTIGSRLQDFFAVTDRIAKMSSKITHFLSGSEISGTIDSLRELMIQMNNYIKDSEVETSQRVEELTRLLSTIKSLYTPIEEIRRNIKRLNTLGFATRIHSGTSDGSSILAEDIERLSSDIVSKKTLILESLQSLAQLIEETLAHVSSINERQLQAVWAVVDNTMSSLTSLSEKRIRSTNSAKSISIYSERAYRSVEEIVKFLQFHDITYQETAYIKDMLYDLDGMVRRVKNEENTRGINLIKHISELGYTCEERAKQISAVRDKFIKAITHIIENLDIVNNNILNVSNDVCELVDKGNSGDQTFIIEIERGLTSITSAVSALSENATRSMGLSKTIRSFSGTLREISAFLENIERIEDDIELIALNASVKAANRGKGGEALGVIAESIQALLADIRTQTVGISRTLRSIITSIEHLSERVIKENERDSEVYNKTEELKTMVESFYRMNQDFATSLTNINKDSHVVSEKIEQTIQDIRTHVVVAEIANRVIIELEEISSHVRELRSFADIPEGEYLVKGIQEEVFSTEEVHFKKTPASDKKDRSTEFGDNVELF